MAHGVGGSGSVIACGEQHRPHWELAENGAQCFGCVCVCIAALGCRRVLRVRDPHDLPSRLNQRNGKIFPKACAMLRVFQHNDRRIVRVTHELALQGEPSHPSEFCRPAQTRLPLKLSAAARSAPLRKIYSGGPFWPVRAGKSLLRARPKRWPSQSFRKFRAIPG